MATVGTVHMEMYISGLRTILLLLLESKLFLQIVLLLIRFGDNVYIV